MSDKNEALVREALQAFYQGDTARLLEMVNPGVESAHTAPEAVAGNWQTLSLPCPDTDSLRTGLEAVPRIFRIMDGRPVGLGP